MANKKEKEIVTTEKTFDLVISEMTSGNLVTNAMVVRDSVLSFLATCDVANYKGTAKDAADDKAKFNALAKTLNDKRIQLEKEFLKPFIPFKEIIKETTDAIEKVSKGLDVIVKAKEREEKEAKKAEIEEIWKVYDFKLVSLEKIFVEKWLNKTYKTKQIHDDIAAIIDRILGDLDSLEQFGEDTASLKELYLSTLDLQFTLRKGAELRENRKRLAEEEERKARLEAERQAALMQKAEEPEPPQQEITVTESEPQQPTYNVDFNARKVTPTEPPKTAEQLYYFYVTMPIAQLAKDCGIESQPIFMSATKQQLLQFKDAMEKNGYEYDKLTYSGKLLLNVRVKR